MKKGILLSTVLLLLLASYTFAQAPDTLWTRNYGYSGFDEAWQLKQTPDGGFIVVGYSEENNDIYLLKTDENGDTLWTSMLGFSSDDVGRSVEPLDDGGFIITGYAGGYIVLMKTDSLGNHLWHHYLDEGWGRAVRVTSDGGFIVAGYAPVPDSSFQTYIAKTDSGGNLVWAKKYGGNEAEMAWDVRETPDGGYVVLGWTESFGNGLADIYLLKTDSNGDTLWTRTYGNNGNDEGRSIIVKEDGGFVLAGKLSRDSYYNDISAINTDSTGNVIWSVSHIQEGRSVANSIAPALGGGYVITGMNIDSSYMLSSCVTKININGDSLWTRIIRDPEQNLYLRSIVQTSDGGYVAAGYHQLPNHANDVFLVKLAPDLTGIDDDLTILPDQISLYQNYPNPFNASTTISFSIPERRYIRLGVFDILGRQIEILFDGTADAGIHSVIFDGNELTSGIYFYSLKAGNLSRTRSMILLK